MKTALFVMLLAAFPSVALADTLDSGAFELEPGQTRTLFLGAGEDSEPLFKICNHIDNASDVQINVEGEAPKAYTIMLVAGECNYYTANRSLEVSIPYGEGVVTISFGIVG